MEGQIEIGFHSLKNSLKKYLLHLEGKQQLWHEGNQGKIGSRHLRPEKNRWKLCGKTGENMKEQKVSKNR